MKTCNTCGKEKPDDMFPKNGVDPQGNMRRRPDCTECYTIKRKIDKSKHNKFVNNTLHRTGEETTYSVSDWRRAVLFFGGCCAYCGKKQSRRHVLTRDHFVPVSKGGRTNRRNILPACQACNSSKADREALDWYAAHKSFSGARLERILQWI